MEPVDILKQHLALCHDVYQLLLEENTWLKVQKKVPEMQFLEKKRKSLCKGSKVAFEFEKS